MWNWKLSSHNFEAFNYSTVKIVLLLKEIFKDVSCCLAYAIVNDYLDS